MKEKTAPGVYVQEGSGLPPVIAGVGTSVAAFIGAAARGPVNKPVLLSSFAEFERRFGGIWPESNLGYVVQSYFLNGGGQAFIVNVSPRLPSKKGDGITNLDLLGDPGSRTGIYALDDASFNLLSIPPPSRGGDTAPIVYQAALAYCVQRNAMLLVDPPFDWGASAKTAVAGFDALGLSGPAARNAAIYYPRLVAPDSADGGNPADLVPSGAVAGIITRTDVQSGIWKAPAGADAAITGITGFQVNVTDGDSELLNPAAINPLRSFPMVGNVVWGARTMRGQDMFEDNFKYISVRRLTIYIEQSLIQGLQWVVFEPNGPALWNRIKSSVTNFLMPLYQAGAFFGATSASAFFVQVDSTTTTPADIANGVVNIQVGFAPLSPAEFLIINIQQAAAAPEA